MGTDPFASGGTRSRRGGATGRQCRSWYCTDTHTHSAVKTG